MKKLCLNDSALSNFMSNSYDKQFNTAHSFLFVFFFIIFIIVYIELILILRYRYKLFSFQSVFLFICLLWSGLKTILYSFTFQKFQNLTCHQVFLLEWFFHHFPTCLQFYVLCLLTLYFVEIILKVLPQFAADPRRYNYPSRIGCASVMLLYLIVNIYLSSSITSNICSTKDSEWIRNFCPRKILYYHTSIQIYITGSFFAFCSFCLAYCLYKIARLHSANVLLQSTETNVHKSIIIGVSLILLGLSHCFALIISNAQAYDQLTMCLIINQTLSILKQQNLDCFNVYVIGTIVWEILPTSLLLLIFRVVKNNGHQSLRKYSFGTISIFSDTQPCACDIVDNKQPE